MADNKQRSLNLDLIRCIAAASVIGVHYFFHGAFYGIPMAGPGMYLLGCIRTGFMVCVPLFALLSGYLCGHKRPGWGYMAKLWPVGLTYLLCGILTLAFRNLVMHDGFTLGQMVIRLVTLNAVPYGWYIGMYAGFYLLMPFLNGAWQALGGKRERQLLLLSLALITVFPNALNAMVPNPDGGYLTLLPNWWEDLWPVTYYFIGAYLREYAPKLSAGKNLLLLLLSLALCGGYNYWRSAGDIFHMPFGNNWGGVQNTVNATLLFLLLRNLDLSRAPGWFAWPVARLSRLSLHIYLCSYISDRVLYYVLLPISQDPMTNLLRLPGAVAASLLASAVIAQAVFWVQAGLEKGIAVRKI